VGSSESIVNASAIGQTSPVVRRGKYLYPPGLRFNLPFYRFHKFFDPQNPILLFEHLRRFGRAAHYRILLRDVVLLNDPADISEILIDKAAFVGKDRTQKRMKILLGEGMITSDGETNRRARRIAAPAFHRRQIERHAAQIVELAARFRDEWQPATEFNIAAEMMRLTLQVTARTLFDTEVTAEIHEINDQVNVVMDLYNFLVALPHAELLLNSPLPQMRRFRAAKKRLDAVVDGMIRVRRSEAEASKTNPEGTRDLLSMLLTARDDQGGSSARAFTSEELRDQVLTLFLAGYETVANALAWTWLLLGQNPGVQERLHAELDSALGDRLPAFDDIPRLEYTGMVLSESMRLYPPAWAMGREVLEDVSIGPYHLRKGTMVFFSQYIVQRDPRWFPDPERFSPERFSASAKSNRPRFAYFPFGGGGRQCIGESFAWMEATLALATISQRWRIELVEGQKIELQPKITLRPKNGIKVKVFPRS
jgi:cytochrome P450